MSPCASENLTVLELDNCPLITDLRWDNNAKFTLGSDYIASQFLLLVYCLLPFLFTTNLSPALTTWWAAIISRELSCKFSSFSLRIPYNCIRHSWIWVLSSKVRLRVILRKSVKLDQKLPMKWYLSRRYDCQLITRAGIRRLRNHLPNIKVWNKKIKHDERNHETSNVECFRSMHILHQWPPLPPWVAPGSGIVAAAPSSSKRGPSPKWCKMDFYQYQSLKIDNSPTAFLLNCQCCFSVFWLRYCRSYQCQPRPTVGKRYIVDREIWHQIIR